MNAFGTLRNLAALAVLTALTLCMAGCAKEEPMPPSTPAHALKSTSRGNTGDPGTIDGGHHGTGTSITDDGDDLGDLERSPKPK